MRETVVQTVFDTRIIAIIRGIYGEEALHLAEALAAGGIRLLEVTFDQSRPASQEDTLQAIRDIRLQMGDRLLVGAGTVTSPELVEKAADAGALYIISPDVRIPVISQTRKLGLVSMPGAMTPTEIGSAYDAGADFVKVFPASNLGSPYIRAIRAPLNHIPLLAVGGISAGNVQEFLDAGCCGAGVGGNLVNRQWISDGNWDAVTREARKLMEAAR